MRKTLLFIQVLLLAIAFASSGSHASAPGDGKVYTSAITSDLGLHSSYPSIGDEGALLPANLLQFHLLRYTPFYSASTVETIRTLVSTPYARAPPHSVPA